MRKVARFDPGFRHHHYRSSTLGWLVITLIGA
jgi:hypothetical protein